MSVRRNSRGPRRAVLTARQVFFSPPNSDLDEQDELKRAFIASIQLQLPNRVFKTTFRNRLDDLNELVHSWLPEERPLHIMDTAVSTGITTWEWTENLRRHGVEHSLSAGDLNTHAYMFSVGGYLHGFVGHLHAFVDEAGRPWQFEVNGKAFDYPPDKRTLLRYFPQFLVLRLGIRLFFASLREASRKQGHRPVQRSCFFCHPLPLVNTRLRQLPNVRIIEDDVCLRNPALDQQFHVLRAANILNKCYFDDATITAILLNLRSRLQKGGVFVVCRSDEQGKNNGTVFRLDPPGTFSTLARIGAGSEIENLVLELPYCSEKRLAA